MSRFVDFKAVKAAVSMLQVLEGYGLAESFRRTPRRRRTSPPTQYLKKSAVAGSFLTASPTAPHRTKPPEGGLIRCGRRGWRGQ